MIKNNLIYLHMEYIEFTDLLILFGITWVFFGLIAKAVTSNEHYEYRDQGEDHGDDNYAVDEQSNQESFDSYDSEDSDSTLVNTGSHVNSEQEFSEEEIDTIHYNTENEN
jgi:hypothetical protein